MAPITAFIPPEITPGMPILARYLHPLPGNIAAAYIAAYSQEGDLVLNPFSRSATVAEEAALLGRHALLCDPNPLVTLVLRGALSPISPKELANGFQRLAQAPKGETSLRNHLSHLYETSCSQCQQPVIAHYFLWDRQLDRPVQKCFTCPTCQRERLEAVDEKDLAAVKDIDKRGFHYWAIMQRLAPPDKAAKALVQRLLGLYTPRNLYALATLVNKVETVCDTPDLLAAFRLILLECLDRGSKLAVPTRGPEAEGKGVAGQPPAPRQVSLRPPPRFLEVNVWEAFETAYTAFLRWCEEAANRPRIARLTDELAEALSPGCPPQASPIHGIPKPVLIKRLSLRRLSEELPPGTVALALGEPPPVQDAFLPLSYLWTGWLLGKEAAQAFTPQHLQSSGRPNQWDRHRQAMTAALRSLQRALTPQGRVVLVFKTGNLTMVRALMLAAAAGGFGLEHLLYQPLSQSEPLGTPPYAGMPGWYILCFQRTPGQHQASPSAASLAPQVRNIALQGAKDVLSKRGEPSPFVWLHHAACLFLDQEGLLSAVAQLQEEGLSPLDFLAENIKKGLEEGLEHDLVQLPARGYAPHPAASTATAEAAAGEPGPPPRILWWLANPPSRAPLSDRVEEAVYQALVNLSPAPLPAIVKAVYPLFPGLETPEQGLIEAVVASYGLLKADGCYYLRQEDRPEQRLAERLDLISLLSDLGRRFGFKVLTSLQGQRPSSPPGSEADSSARREGPVGRQARREAPLEPTWDVVWCRRGKPAYLFTVEWTARLHDALLRHRMAGNSLRRYLVIPEERVALIRYKIARQVLWQQALAEGGWDFIKYGHLRRFAAGQPRLEGLERIVGLAPLVEQYPTQLPLF